MSKEIKFHEYWIYGLTAAWLLATFEHNYFTLSKYSHHLMVWGIDVSGVANVLLVVALDLSVFWAVKFIPQAKVWGVSIRGAQFVLLISTLFSILLNIRYMVTASPSSSFFDMTIAIITGTIIPSYVAVFGWIEGNVSVKRASSIIGTDSRKSVGVEEVVEYMRANPKTSKKDVAAHFGVSLNTIQNRLNEYKAMVK